jgi:hypothetical protein
MKECSAIVQAMHLRNTFVKYSYMHEESLYVFFVATFHSLHPFWHCSKKEKITEWKEMIFLCTCNSFFSSVSQICISTMHILYVDMLFFVLHFCEKRLSPDATKILKKCSIVSTNDKYYFISLIFVFVDVQKIKDRRNCIFCASWMQTKNVFHGLIWWKDSKQKLSVQEAFSMKILL